MAATTTDRKPLWRSYLDAVASLAMTAASIVVIWAVVSGRLGSQPSSPPCGNPSTEPPVPSSPISLAGAALRGDLGAKIVVVEYSDFQCPFCARFTRETLPEVVSRYVDTGKVLLAFRHLPLEQIHKAALKAAEAAECAKQQGKFWQMHDSLFSDQKRLDEPSLLSRAGKIGLDPSAFRACLEGAMISRVRSDAGGASELKITGTPTFLFGTLELDGRVRVARRVSGAVPLRVFTGILDQLGGFPSAARK